MHGLRAYFRRVSQNERREGQPYQTGRSHGVSYNRASMLKSLLTLVLLAISPGLRAQSSPATAALPEDLKSKIDAAANQILSSTKVPSASIAIVKDGHIAYLQAYGQARLSLPMDAQGGEKIETMERLYSILATDAKERGILRDDFYFISDDTLGRFKMFQGFDYFTPFSGYRVEQAFRIWAQCPQNMLQALVSAIMLD